MKKGSAGPPPGSKDRGERKQDDKSEDAATGLKSSRAWFVLNQPFTLFVLSSIVIAGLSSLYQYRQQQALDTATRTERTLRLSHELGYRAIVGHRIFRGMNVTGPMLEKATEQELKSLLEQLSSRDRLFAANYLFPEYKDWTLEALLRAVVIEDELPGSRPKVDKSIRLLMGGALAYRDARADMRGLEVAFEPQRARNAIVSMIAFMAALEVTAKDDREFVFRSQFDPATGKQQPTIGLERSAK